MFSKQIGLFIASLLLTSLPAIAQVPAGNVTGRVADPPGFALPGVHGPLRGRDLHGPAPPRAQGPSRSTDPAPPATGPAIADSSGTNALTSRPASAITRSIRNAARDMYPTPSSSEIITNSSTIWGRKTSTLPTPPNNASAMKLPSSEFEMCSWA